MSERLESYKRQINWLDEQIEMLSDNIYTKMSGRMDKLIAQRQRTYKKQQILEALIARKSS